MSSNAQILPLFRLVTPTANYTQAAATTNANKLFNTNIVIGTYMNIRAVHVIQAFKTQIGEGANMTTQHLYELSEDTTRTTVAQTDPFALVDGGIEIDNTTSTAAGFYNVVRDLIREHWFLPPHPGVPTVAQQLNLVATGLRIVGASVQQVDVFAQIFYQILPLTEDIKSFLTNRIVLQRTT